MLLIREIKNMKDFFLIVFIYMWNIGTSVNT